jgi:hypothetical protein
MIVQCALDLGVVCLSDKFQSRRMTDICIFGTVPYNPFSRSSDFGLDAATAPESTSAPRNCDDTRLGLANHGAGHDQNIIRIQPHHVAPMTRDQVYTISDE